MKTHRASFRDPSGHLFEVEGELFRQVNSDYAEHYDRLMESGLYADLVERGWLVEHEEVDPGTGEDAYRVLRPQRIPFISYPYEWSFGQYRAAAIRTLQIQARALEHGMTLKDASAYNIQFVGYRPVLIDTLSFETYREGEPWVAYRQFCQHFLAPLALASLRDVRLLDLMRRFIDGVPLDLATTLLPVSAKLKPALQMHLFLHARGQAKKAASGEAKGAFQVSQSAFKGLIDSLRKGVRKMTWAPPDTEWGDYYSDTNYTESSHEQKAKLVGEYLEAAGGETAWDLGANTGRFSRIASELGRRTVAFDIDPVAVEKNFRRALKEKDEQILPLRMDLTNPSPGIGWGHEERDSLETRGPADVVMALALVHHLAIGNNVPLPRVAETFSRLGRHLIVEFVPKSDSQVERLLSSREDVFPTYTEEGFEAALSECFEILRREPIEGSERTLYLCRARTES